MPRIHVILMLALIGALSVRCAEFPSGDWYQEPPSGARSVAMIECYRTGNPNIILIGIDGRYTGCSKSDVQRRLSLGSHRFVLLAVSNDAVFSHGFGQFLLKRVQAEDASNPTPLPKMSFLAKDGGRYRIHGYFGSDLAEYWITDNDTGQIVAISRLSRGDDPSESTAKPGMARPDKGAGDFGFPAAKAPPSHAAGVKAGSSDINCRPAFSAAGACTGSDPNAR